MRCADATRSPGSGSGSAYSWSSTGKTEVIVLHFDDGREMVIHAMPMRIHYRRLLPRPPETRR